MSTLIPDMNSYIPPAPDSGKKKTGTNALKKLSAVVGIIAVTGTLVVGSLAVVKYKPELLGLSKSSTKPGADEAEIKSLVAEVGKIIELPFEQPVLATVSDLNKVKDQQFFANAKLNDKVLIYTNAKKAILYRPSEHKIIEVGRVNDSQGQVAGEKSISVSSPTATQAPTVSPEPTIIPTATSTAVLTPTP